MFHGPVDRKDLRYQAWKHGLYPFNVESAVETMIADPNRDSLVLGKTVPQLTAKFGYLRTAEQATPYEQYCYENSSYRGKPVLYLRNSNWMVLMENGRAAELVLVKGC
jgi:hypothetical protein